MTHERPPIIRLYHRTTLEGMTAIVVEGFRDGEDGGVWLSEFDDAWGNQGDRRLAVDIPMDREELSSYGHEATADEVWSDDAGDFVPADNPNDIERFVWYRIPAVVLNSRGTVAPNADPPE